MAGRKFLSPIKIHPRFLTSNVEGFMGDCVPTWLNTNRFCNITDGGMTGFFKKTKRLLPGVYLTTGEEFHGIITKGGVIHSTEGMY